MLKTLHQTAIVIIIATIIIIASSYVAVVSKNADFCLKINTKTYPKKENNLIQYSSPVFQSNTYSSPVNGHALF